MNFRLIQTALLVITLVAGCEGRQPVRGFVLPEGDTELGRQVFIDYNCYRCHDIAGVELPDRGEFEPPFVVELGGKVMRVKNYGELLTAVVYPEHVISPNYRAKLMQAGKQPDITPMPNFTEQMTVAELINLTEFLHAQYERLQPTYYRGHYPAPMTGG